MFLTLVDEDNEDDEDAWVYNMVSVIAQTKKTPLKTAQSIKAQSGVSIIFFV